MKQLRNKLSLFAARPLVPHVSFIIYPLLLVLSCVFAASCSKDDSEEYTPYYDWQVRNDAWFLEKASQARNAIAAAREQYGDDWESHCEWRMYKSLMKSNTFQSGLTTDTICMRRLKAGTGTTYAKSTDAIEVAFQGYLMPTQDALGNTFERLFTNTYIGDFDSQTATFNAVSVSTYKDGFYTALQYMVSGDSWEVFIPYQLFYGETEQTNVPAYSSVRFLIHRK